MQGKKESCTEQESNPRPHEFLLLRHALYLRAAHGALIDRGEPNFITRNVKREKVGPLTLSLKSVMTLTKVKE